MGKRKPAADVEDHIGEPPADSEGQPPEQPEKKKRASKKAEKPTEPYEDAGWTIVPPSLLWR